MARSKKEEGTYFDRLEDDIKSNQNTLSLVLGALIVIVVGILLFNYFNKQEPQITPESETVTEQSGDVSPTDLPGKYTVKEGDTLFTIAEKYYGDGYQYEEIAKANSFTDVNTVAVGQEITIPRIEGLAEASPEATALAEATTAPEATPVVMATPAPAIAEDGGQGTGGGNTTIWGPKIEGGEYTVVEGDWLSTIAARAYGDILSYQKIAEANKIQNPDVITPGMKLTLPR